jgi:hypothetical protein
MALGLPILRLLLFHLLLPGPFVAFLPACFGKALPVLASLADNRHMLPGAIRPPASA